MATKMIEAIYRVPGQEQYSYLEVRETVESVEDAIEGFNHAIKVYKGQGEGLSAKDMNRAVCEYLETGSLINGTELYQQMSPSQQEWFQITKRAFKRIKSTT